MNYALVKDMINLLEQFEAENGNEQQYPIDLIGFKRWVNDTSRDTPDREEPHWEGKENGRSAESVINTLIVHMSRYAKSYSKSAIMASNFASQEDFIYLINLKAFGPMSKMDLIRKNVHEKPVGMQTINRLIKQGWVDQTDSENDRRSKVISITALGLKDLEAQMAKIRQASHIVTGDLTYIEKMELIRLLSKLDDFHQTIYDENIDLEYLLETAMKNKKSS